MKRKRSSWRRHSGKILWACLGLAGLAVLLWYHLPTLVDGFSLNEFQVALTPIGWHGLYHSPLFLPLRLLRSVIFFLQPHHGLILTRLANTVFGGLAVMSFAWLIWLWHGSRTAVLTTLLFATGAWTLHVSRLASNDVMYLWALPTLLLIQVLLYRWGKWAIVWYGSLLTWGLMLYIPGMIWLMLLQILGQRSVVSQAWSNFRGLSARFLTFLSVAIWLPLLVIDLLRPGQLLTWLGMPAHWPPLHHLAKEFLAVPVHLFVRGPQYPDLWLGKAPIFDIFSLICVLLGLYFYVSHGRASRSLTLGLLFGGAWILTALGGPFSLSFLVALLYVTAAAGLAYLLQAWLKVFPLNPLARGLGIGLISLAVALSCYYNLRAYFVAWPHNPVTKETFIYHLV